MGMASDLRSICAAARPLIEQWLDIGEQIAALRDTAAAKGIDWSQLKGLLKAQIQDERDENSAGKRVKRIVERAEYASSYAELLGLAEMNEENFLAAPSFVAMTGSGHEYHYDADTGEVIETGTEPTPQVPSGEAFAGALPAPIPENVAEPVALPAGDGPSDAMASIPQPEGLQSQANAEAAADTGSQSVSVEPASRLAIGRTVAQGEVAASAVASPIPDARTPIQRTMDEVQAQRAAKATPAREIPTLIRGWTPKQPRPAICLDHSCDSYGPDGFMPCHDCLRVARAA